MIERRYPIQTVLAERKMFAGGGAVLPQQMMPQQQQMMPQQQQSGGILASSGPLLDAVAAGAINPDGDGGASLSDVQGFANGGLSTSQDLPYITRYDFENQTGGPSDRPDSRFLPESGMTTDISAQLTGATDEQLRQFISSVDPITQGYVLSQAQSELDRRSSLGALNTQPVNSLTPLYDFNDISDNAEDQAEGFSGQDQDPGGMTGPGFSNFSNQDPKTSFTISGIKESHPARSVTTNAQMAQYRAMKELEALAKGSAAATGNPSQDAVTETAAAVSMGIDSFDPDYMDETTTSITDAMDVGFDDSMGPSAGDPSDPTEDDDEDGAGSEDEGAAAADGGYFTSRMYNANSGQSGYPNMTAAEEIENGVQRFDVGGSVITPQGIPVNLSAEAAEAADAARGAMVDFGPTPWLGEVPSRITPYMTSAERVEEDRRAFRDNLSRMSRVAAGENFDPAASTEFVDPDDLGGDPGRPDARVLSPEIVAAALKMQEGSNFESAGKEANKVFRERYRSGFSEENPIVGRPDGEVYEEGLGGGGPSKAAEAAKSLNLQEVLTEDMYGFPESGTEPTADVTPVSAEAGVGGESVGGSQIEAQSDADSSENVVENVATIFGDIFSDSEPPKSPDKTKSAMAKAVEDFKSAMPEYEGMSESEKGYAIMEAGLRIMAGKSPDALTNIAEGLKGLGPKFAKDAKDKRAWNRQVELSAAKYGLENVAREAAEDRSDARKVFFFYDQTKKTKDNPYGPMVAYSMADIVANGGKIPKGLVEKDLISKSIASANANTLRLQKLITDNAKIYRIGNAEKTTLTEDLDVARTAFVSGQIGIDLLSTVKAQVAKDDITGLGNAGKELYRRAFASINLDVDKKYKNISAARADIRRAFQSLIPLSLGSSQSANSISDKDVRFLADAYVNSGFLKDGILSFATVDSSALGKQLDGAIGKFRESQKQGLTIYNRVLKRIDSAEAGLAGANSLGVLVSPGPFGREYFQSTIDDIAPYAEKTRSRLAGRKTKPMYTPKSFGAIPGYDIIDGKYVSIQQGGQ
jgi:hypothetical protein